MTQCILILAYPILTSYTLYIFFLLQKIKNGFNPTAGTVLTCSENMQKTNGNANLAMTCLKCVTTTENQSKK